MTAQLAQTPVFKAFDNNGLPLFLGQLCTYAAGTTTPQATYVDSTQTTQNTNPVILNARGEANVWLNPTLSYKFVLQDSFGNQIWAVDNIQGALSLSGNIIPSADNQFSLGNASFRFANGYFGTQLYVGSSNTPVLNGGIVGYWPQTAAEIAAGVTPTNYAYAPGVVDRYGTNTAPGTTDMTAAWNAAIAQASQAGGAAIVAQGTYLIVGGTPLVIAASGVRVTGSGAGSTKLLAGANGIDVIKIAASNCTLSDILIDGNGYTNVTGLAVAPANEADTTHTSFVDYNSFRNLQIQNCYNGTRMRCGPTVGGADSGCYYNVFLAVFWLNCIRAVWMQNSVNDGSGAPNRGSFHGCRAGSAGNVTNTGLQIDAGGTNQFFGMHFEGMNNGTSPTTIPTAVIIAAAGSSGADNLDNQFFGCINEANTLDLDNQAAFTEILGGVWTASKFAAGMVLPIQMVGGTDASVMPTIIEGMMHGEGEAGFPSGFWGMSKEIADYLNGVPYNWQNYALSTGIMTNVSSISFSVSSFRKSSNMVEWDFCFSFDAAVGATQVTITPPVPPNGALYQGLTTTNSFFTFSVANGSGTVYQVAAGFTNTGKFFVAAPSGAWSTSGNFNQVYGSVRYHS